MNIKIIGTILCAIGKMLGGTVAEGVKIKPKIKPVGTISMHTALTILRAKLNEMGDNEAEIFLPDAAIKTYAKADVEKAYSLELVSSVRYVAEVHDCDDFAAELYGKFAGLVWSDLHALNFFFDEDETMWFIEPQSKKLARQLAGWQGTDIRFFIAR